MADEVESAGMQPEQSEQSAPVENAPSAKSVPEVQGFLASTARNPWLCPNGHLMGLIVRKKIGNNAVNRLYVLRMAFHPNQIVPEPFIFAIMDSGAVACSICGAEREWRPSNDFLQLIATRRRPALR